MTHRVTLINIQQTAALIGLSVSSVRQRCKEEGFPKPLGGFKKKKFWVQSAIEDYILRCHNEANVPVVRKATPSGEGISEATKKRLAKHGLTPTKVEQAVQTYTDRVNLLKKAGIYDE